MSVQTDGSYQHEYVLRDHLGNTRVTFSDANNDGVVGSTDIKQINSYYPFGLNMESNFNGAAGKNKYAYNGKEWNDDFGLGWNDYGARFYDPAGVRWWSIDPSSEKDYGWNPYVYVYNNPITLIDPDGKEAEYPIITITNQKVGKADARVIGYVQEGTTTSTDLYKAIVTDTEDPNFRMEFAVTRDAWATTKDDSQTGSVSNTSFEPKDGNINHYTAKMEFKEYPKESGSGVAGLKLTQKGSEEMHAAPREASVKLEYREKAAVAKGVMIHVGGYYKTNSGTKLAASEGCFGICNTNNSRSNTSNKYAANVMNTLKTQANKSKTNPGKIEVVIQKRNQIVDKKKL